MRTIVPAIAAALLAVAAPAAAEIKIGVLDPVKLQRAPELRGAHAKLEAEFQKRQDEVNAEGKKLDDDIGRFRREADTLSPQQRTAAQNDLNTRKTNFELKQRQYSEEFQRRRAEIGQDVNAKLQRAIAEVAREKGLDVILENAAYYAPALDVTAAVMAKLASYGPTPEPAAAPKQGEKKK